MNESILLMKTYISNLMCTTCTLRCNHSQQIRKSSKWS